MCIYGRHMDPRPFKKHGAAAKSGLDVRLFVGLELCKSGMLVVPGRDCKYAQYLVEDGFSQ